MGWTLFTLAAGFVNAGALFACNNVVTHITGSITNIAVDASLASHLALVVLLFIVGGMIAVLMGEMFESRPKLAFVLPVLMSFGTLLAIAIAGRAGYFGAFGVDSEKSGRAFAMLGLLAAAMGMANASIAVATDNQIRIAHLTGPATDLAGNVVRGILGSGRGSRVELRWAAIRMAKLTAFAFGAAIAAKVAGALQYDVFAVGAGILVVALGFAGSPDESVPQRSGDAANDKTDDHDRIPD